MSENRRRRRADISIPYTEEPQSYAEPVQPERAQYVPTSDNRTVIVNQIGVSPNVGFGNQSYFDGGLLSLIGWSLLSVLLTLITFGLGYPFAACMMYSWEARHTVINGRRLRFDGTGMQLLGNWIIWLLLTLITLGIYGFWLSIKLKQWRVKHTHFE